MLERIRSFLHWFYDTLFKYAWKFGIVGLLGYFIDVTIFNVLRTTVLTPERNEWGPLIATVISVAIATLATWFGNRYWAFRDHRRKNFWLELTEFAITSTAGLGIALLCLWISHYLLGFTSVLADNISKNVIGLVLATAFRFFMYRFWVFSPARKDAHSRLQREADEADERAAREAVDLAPAAGPSATLSEP